MRSWPAIVFWIFLASAGLGRLTAETSGLPPEQRVVFQIDGPVNALLMQAKALAADNKPELVFPLLEQILAESPESLASTDGEQYLPARRMVHQMLLSMPPGTLAAYRSLADPSARVALRAYEETLDPQLLADCHARYFLSLLGDQVAWRYATCLLDMGDYPRARAVLAELAEHPDADLPAAQWLPRLALAHWLCRDEVAARAAWAAYQRLAPAPVAGWDPLAAALARGETAGPPPSTTQRTLGNPAQDGWSAGAMPLPEAPRSLWAVEWRQPLSELLFPQMPNRQLMAPSSHRPSAKAQRMNELGWHPPEQLTLAHDRLWVSGGADLLCLDLATGKRLHEVVDNALPPVDDKNQQAVQARNMVLNMVQQWAYQVNQPDWLLQSRLARAQSIVEGRVYRVESHVLAGYSPNAWQWRNQRQQLAMGNRLLCVEEATGKVLWRLGREPGASTAPVVPARPLPDDGVVYEVPELKDLVIDGKTADWRGRGLAIKITDRGDAKNLSQQTWLAWNEAGLVVRTEVKDDVVNEFEDGTQLFRGDSVEYFVGERRGSPLFYQIIASTGADPKFNKPRIHYYDHRQNKPAQANATLSATMGHGQAEEQSYVVEMLLPWSNLGIKPEKNRELGFQFFINDKDGGEAHWVGSWYPKTGTHQEPANMHRIKLVAGEASSAKPAPAPPPVTPPPPPAPKRWEVDGLRFLSAPTPCAGLVVVPAEDSEGLLVLGLQPASGLPAWRLRLRLAAAGPTPPLQELHLTVAGGQVYLATSQGMVLALDGATGTVLWGHSYPSELAEALPELAATDDEAEAPSDEEEGNGQPVVSPAEPQQGWLENLTVVHGESLLVMVQNGNHLMSYDRQRGRLVWRQPRPPELHTYLGRSGDGLLYVGLRHVGCLDPATGQLRWLTECGIVTGRPALAGEELWVPVGERAVRVALSDGRQRGELLAQLPDELPLGNLYALPDGGLLVLGPDHLTRLKRADARLQELDRQLASAPTAKLARTRGELYLAARQYGEALRDLRQALAGAPDEAFRGAVAEQILEACLALARREASQRVALLREALQLPLPPARLNDARLRLVTALRAGPRPADLVPVLVDLLTHHDGMSLIGPADEGQLLPPLWAASFLREPASAKLPAASRQAVELALAQWCDRQNPARRTLRYLAGLPTPAGEAPLVAYLASLVKDQRPGMATALALRLLPHLAGAERQALATWLAQLYLVERYLPGLLTLEQEMAIMEPGWQMRDPAGEPVAAAALARQWLTLGNQERPATQIQGNPGMGSNPRGYFTMVYRGSQELVLTSWRTGQAIYKQTLTGNNIQSWNMGQFQLHNLGLLGDSQKGFQAMDLWTGKQWPLQSLKGEDWQPAGGDAFGLAICYSPRDGGTLMALDLATDTLLWRRPNIFDKLTANTWMRLMPAPEGFVLASGASLHSFDRWTGMMSEQPMEQRRWQEFNQAQQFGQQLISVRQQGDELRGVSLVTGETRWTYPEKLSIRQVQPLAGGLVAIMTADERTILLEASNGRVILATKPKALDWQMAICNPPGSDTIVLMTHTESRVLTLVSRSAGKIIRTQKLDQHMYPLGALSDGHLLLQGSQEHEVTNAKGQKQKQRFQVFQVLSPTTGEAVRQWPAAAELGKGQIQHRQAFATPFGLLIWSYGNNASATFMPYGGYVSEGAK